MQWLLENIAHEICFPIFLMLPSCELQLAAVYQQLCLLKNYMRGREGGGWGELGGCSRKGSLNISPTCQLGQQKKKRVGSVETVPLF